MSAPAQPDDIARRALALVRERLSGARGALRWPDLSLLARLLDAGAGVRHAELLSFLLFDEPFMTALIALARPIPDAGRTVHTTWTTCGSRAGSLDENPGWRPQEATGARR